MEPLHLLLADDKGAPAMPTGLPAEAVIDPAAAVAALSFWDEGRDPQSLPDQRWGVVAPEGPAGDALLAALDPLVRRRAEEQGAPVVVHRWPAGATPADAPRWRRQVFKTGAGLDRDVPRYVLALGDLDALPAEVHGVLQTDAYLGRLPLDPAGVEAYVAKVLRWESAAPGAPAARLHTVPDGTAATRAGLEHLQVPAAALLAAEHPTVATDGPAGLDGLRAALAADRPTALLTVSHGRGPSEAGWADAGERRRLQGALSGGGDALYTGEDAAAGPLLPGGLWLLVACYSAGTPARSAYAPWLRTLLASGAFRGSVAAVLRGLPAPGEAPFVAALPKAALANPDGPLGLVGHLDIAWTYAFRDLDHGATTRPGPLAGILAAALRGDRLGVALRATLGQLAGLDAELAWAQSMAPEGPVDANRAHLWMLRQDLAGYVLLGDPAARLRVTAPVRG